MAKLNYTYNVNDLPQSEEMDFSPLPAGWYTAEIKSAEVRQTKAGTGEYIKLRFDVISDKYQGRVVFTNLNIANQNQKAQEIGLRQFGDLLRSIGLPTIDDTDQLIGHACQIKLKIRQDEQYGDSNDVVAYKAIQGSAPPPVFPPAQPKPAPIKPTNANGAPPWAK